MSDGLKHDNSKDIGEIVEQILSKYDDDIGAIIGYGSQFVGQAREGSMYDFWVLTEDSKGYHNKNKDKYSGENGLFGNVFFQWIINKISPNYYFDKFGDIETKQCVFERNRFQKRCSSFSMYVKGRMQKPVRIVYTKNDLIKQQVIGAIDKARDKGVVDAINMCKRNFTFDEFAENLIMLSYQSDIRSSKENNSKKRDFEKYRDEFEEIYRLRLTNNSLLIKDNDNYVRKDVSAMIFFKHLKTNIYLKLNKPIFAFYNIKSYMTMRNPLNYLMKKIRRYK